MRAPRRPRLTGHPSGSPRKNGGPGEANWRRRACPDADVSLPRRSFGDFPIAGKVTRRRSGETLPNRRKTKRRAQFRSSAEAWSRPQGHRASRSKTMAYWRRGKLYASGVKLTVSHPAWAISFMTCSACSRLLAVRILYSFKEISLLTAPEGPGWLPGYPPCRRRRSRPPARWPLPPPPGGRSWGRCPRPPPAHRRGCTGR